MTFVVTVEEAWKKRQKWGVIKHPEHWGTELRLGRFSAFLQPKLVNYPFMFLPLNDDDSQIWLLLWRRFYITYWGKENIIK